MRSPSLRVKVFRLLLAIALVVPWGATAEPRPATAATARLAAAASPNLLSRLWLFVTGLWGDAGCHIDPDGRCSPGTTDQGDTGCHIDPHGGCGDAVTVEPSGTDQADTGCHIDPSGHCGG